MNDPVADSVAGLLQSLGENRVAWDGDRLLARVLDCTLAKLRAFPERVVDAERLSQWRALVDRRAAGEPYAYLVGEQEFWSLTLAVGPGVLIPRGDSELLVEAALARIDSRVSGWVADVGTGSANLALALASERPRLTLLGIEASAPALAWAKLNCRRHRLKNICLIRARGLATIPERSLQALISNPPYIVEGDPDLDPATLRFEPSSALFAAESGLALLRELAIEGLRVLKPGGWLLLEHGWTQGAAVLELLRSHGYGECRTLLDLASRPRVTLGQRQS